MKFLFASICIATSLIAPVSAQEQDYTIKLSYPLKVNQRYHLTATGKDTMQRSVSAEGKILRNEKNELNAELESTVTVLEVDTIGRPTREAHQIIRFVRIKDGFPEVMIGSGTKVMAFRRDKEEVFEVQNKPVSTEIHKLLGMLISTSGGGPSDDEIFGTTERKKVGDSWRINEELALKKMRDDGGQQTAGLEKLTGTTTLQKVTKAGATDVLHLTSTIRGSVKPPSPGNITATGELEMNFSGAFPANGFTSTIEESVNLKFAFKASGRPHPDGPPMEMTGDATRVATTVRKPLR